MEKFQSMIHLVGSKGVVGIYKTIDEMQRDIRDRIEENTFGFEEVGDDLRILNVTYHVHQGHGFDIEVIRDMPSVDIEDNKCYDSGKYRIKNGKFRGEEFSNQDDLNDFLRSEWRDGNLTLEELREITIEITEESTFEFFDHTETNETELEIDDVNIAFGSNIDLNVFGKEFVLEESLMHAQPTPEQALIPTKEYQKLLRLQKEYDAMEIEVATLKNNLIDVTPAFIMNVLNNLTITSMTELEIRQMLNTFSTLTPKLFSELEERQLNRYLPKPL